MRYFKDDKDGFYGIVDDEFIAPSNFTELTQAEITALLTPTPEQIAFEAIRIADQADVSAAKVDPVIQCLVTHTPQECADYVQTNVTNLATAKDVLAKIAMALCVIAKDKLRG